MYFPFLFGVYETRSLDNALEMEILENWVNASKPSPRPPHQVRPMGILTLAVQVEVQRIVHHP